MYYFALPALLKTLNALRLDDESDISIFCKSLGTEPGT